MLKKLSVLLPSCSNLNCLYCHQSATIHTSSSSRKSQRLYCPHPREIPLGCFAHTRSNTSQAAPLKDSPWPDASSPNAVPTPYQIFGLRKGSPYSKRRFYELVKIYHPDRHNLESEDSDTQSLPRSMKTERYRLIVTAHEILSDPGKRSAYDKSGAGWGGRLDSCTPKYTWGRKNDARWSGFDTNDSPFGNATWEDWEKWYQRDKAKQEPVYFSNGGFLTLVLATILLAGFGQSIRVGDYSNVFQQQVEKAHDNASMAIQQSRTESQAFGDRDERLQNFLRTRDSHGYGTTDLTEENYGKISPEPEICMSEDVNETAPNNSQDSSS